MDINAICASLRGGTEKLALQNAIIKNAALKAVCESLRKNKAEIFVHNHLKCAEKFSWKSLVKTGKILYNVYIVKNNGYRKTFFIPI